MTTHEGFDSTLDADLARLPVRDARAERVEEIRAACLAALARTREKPAARRRSSGIWRAPLETVAAAGLSVLFLAAAVGRALEILR